MAPMAVVALKKEKPRTDDRSEAPYIPQQEYQNL
jgi:hypothetical protein